MTTSLKEDNRPAQQWYWDDWFSAFDVRLCSLAARGLWIDMLGIMFKAEIRGTLTVNGKQINGKHLAKIIGAADNDIKSLLSELEEQDVFSRLPDGTIYCRRMFKESGRKDEISRIRSEAGKKGADNRWRDKTTVKTDGKNITKMAASSASSSPTASPTAKNKSPRSKFSDAQFAIASALKEKILINIPEQKITDAQVKSWANIVRLMEEQDKRSQTEILSLVEWASRDSFWYKNILSMGKLRDKYGRLLADMRDGSRKKVEHRASQIGSTPSSTAPMWKFHGLSSEDEWSKVMALYHKQKKDTPGLMVPEFIKTWKEGRSNQ